MTASHVLYFVLWSSVFPQIYESFIPRAVCIVLLISLCVFRCFQPLKTPWFIAWYHFTVIGCGPTYFTFMVLMNHDSGAWLGSAICSIQLLSLMVDAPVLLAWISMGIGAGMVSWRLVGGTWALPPFSGEHLMIYLFSLLTAVIFNTRSRSIRDTSVRATRLAIGYISHELSTPVACIEGTSDWIRSRVSAVLHQPELPSVDINVAFDELFDATREIRDTLAGFSIMASETEGGSSPSCLLRCINDASALAALRFGKVIKVTAEVPASLEVTMPPTLLVRIFYNLLVNAHKSIVSAGSGEIFITAEASKSACIVRVRDTGLGIPAPLRSEIFRPLFSWSITKSIGEGSGMGLHFCRAAVEARDGRLSVRSKLGQYAEFSLHLPRASPIEMNHSSRAPTLLGPSVELRGHS